MSLKGDSVLFSKHSNPGTPEWSVFVTMTNYGSLTILLVILLIAP